MSHQEHQEDDKHAGVQEGDKRAGVQEGDGARLSPRDHSPHVELKQTLDSTRASETCEDDRAAMGQTQHASQTGEEAKELSDQDEAPQKRRRLPRRAAQLTWRDDSAMNRGHYNRVSVNNETEKEIHMFLRVYRTSLAQAMKDEDRKEQRMRAAETEITNLYMRQKCLDPVKKKEIPKQHLSKIMNGHMFFKDKYRADGSYEQCKARIVMNGNEQDPDTIESKRSPTVNPISLKCTLAKSANDPDYTNDAYDVVGAFVCTEMPKDKIIIMKARETAGTTVH